MNLSLLSLLSLLLVVVSGLVQASSSPPTSTTALKAGVQPDLFDKIRLLRAMNTKNVPKPKDHIKCPKTRRRKGSMGKEIYKAVAGKQDWQDIIRELAWHHLIMSSSDMDGAKLESIPKERMKRPKDEKEEKFEVAMSLYNLMVTHEAIEGNSPWLDKIRERWLGIIRELALDDLSG
ncbi:hypothetical protein K440DRAFT_641562 [Wilcoxina mikolae CBS 423.85]|nr:hypothetical protein K440DRAFT_641562 [Wilcoxina mikolae CBS 423.85]